MANVIEFAKFKLLSEDKKDAWQTMSDQIAEQLKSVDGFISRDAGYDAEGNGYCIVKWENKDAQAAFHKVLETEMKEEMKAFAEIVDMKTMTGTKIELI